MKPKALVLAAALMLMAGPALAETYKAGAIQIEQPWARATPKGAPAGAPFSWSRLCENQEVAPLVIVVTPRRSCAQQSSLDSVQIGRSLP